MQLDILGICAGEHEHFTIAQKLILIAKLEHEVEYFHPCSLNVLGHLMLQIRERQQGRPQEIAESARKDKEMISLTSF